VRLDDDLGHLTYSTLVHDGDTWPEMEQSVFDHIPAVAAAVAPGKPFGVSLRLSHASVETLQADPSRRASFRQRLDDQNLYVYTVNAFPYGPFKGGRVKERVYAPDWTDRRRVDYTIAVAEILAEITPAAVNPSIQSAPLAFARDVTGPEYVDTFTGGVLDVVAALVDLEDRTGRRVTLALEPEPACFLETTEETVRYFTERLWTGDAARALAARTRRPVSDAIGLMRRHVGVVFDIGHQAVGFEDIPSSLQLLVAAGVPIFKLQQAAALWAPEVDDDVVAELERFTGTIYLSQTNEVRDGVLRRYLNLEDALESWKADKGPREWRTHFHVPVFLDELGAFRTTRFAVDQALDLHKAQRLSDHLEIETYTWDVLPEQLKTGTVDDFVARELEYVQGRLR